METLDLHNDQQDNVVIIIVKGSRLRTLEKYYESVKEILIQWPQHGEEILENTLRILRGWQYPLMSGGEADGQGGYCSTSKDEEGILQYLRAMLRPLTLL